MNPWFNNPYSPCQINMNYINQQNELLKCVLEGMGEEPSDDMQKNWDTIMNYNNQLNNTLGIGRLIDITFSDMTGVKRLFKIGEDTPLKQIFIEFGKRAGFTEDDIKQKHFICNGLYYAFENETTLKGNNIKDGDTFIVN